VSTAARTSAAPEERALLSAQLGVVVPVDDAPALLDPRSARTARLAWVGRSLLELLLVRVLAGADDPAPLEGLLSDEALARTLAATGLPALLDVPPEQPADLVRAAVASGHRGAGFFGARSVAVRLVSPALAEPRLPRSLSPAQAVEGGRAVLSATAALLLSVRSPDDDVAALSSAAARLLDPARLAAGDGDAAGPDAAERAQAELGRVLVVRGEQAAVSSALPLLR
jgi:hypothetical protein